MAEFLDENPFDHERVLYDSIPKDASDTEYLDPIEHLIPVIRTVLAESGLKLLVASDRLILDDLFGNVAAHMWVSKYGIGLLEDRIGQGLNYNVMTELGAMLMTGRRCALLKDIARRRPCLRILEVMFINRSTSMMRAEAPTSCVPG